MIVFDIETGPLDSQYCNAFLPKDSLKSDPGPFDPDSVKLGNTKDFDKIQAKVETARVEHEAKRAALAGTNSSIVAQFIERCALNAETCEVLAIGYMKDDESYNIHCAAPRGDIDGPDESALLEWFWNQASGCMERGESMIGFNCLGFDLPILLRRSLICGVDVPNKLLEGWRSKLYFHAIFKDLLEVWRCGSRDFISLDVLCRAFQCGNKPDDMNGADFAKVFKVDRPKAIAYLQNDLAMTLKLAKKMQLV